MLPVVLVAVDEVEDRHGIGRAGATASGGRHHQSPQRGRAPRPRARQL